MTLGFAARPHLCIALPGIHYTHDNAYTLCTLPIVPYLEQDFEVTLVYRKLLAHVDAHSMNHQYMTILGKQAHSSREQQNQQRYFNGDKYWAIRRYQEEIRNFAEQHAQRFDFVIEKQWPWIGTTVEAFQQRGVPASLVLEAWWQAQPRNHLDSAKVWVKGLLSPGLQQRRRQLCHRGSQQAASIITETQEMGDILREQQYVPQMMPLHTIPNGMNADLFYPRDRHQCRQELGIAPHTTVLTYVGSLGRGIQEPGRLIEALGREWGSKEPSQNQSPIVLYIVGDGWKRQELEAIAQEFNTPAVFTGRVPQAKAAQYIGAADLCVAPYDLSMFFQHRFTSGSLKVPEYLACGRLTVATPCNQMRHLTADETYGFLVENTVEGYRQFLHQLPSRSHRSAKEEQLQKDLAQGVLRRKKILMPWSDIADAYKAVIYEALDRKHLSQAPRLVA